MGLRSWQVRGDGIRFMRSLLIKTVIRLLHKVASYNLVAHLVIDPTLLHEE